MRPRRGLSPPPGENCDHGKEPQRVAIPVDRQTELVSDRVEEGEAVQIKGKHRQQ